MSSPPNTLPDLYIHYINNVHSIQFPYLLNELLFDLGFSKYNYISLFTYFLNTEPKFPHYYHYFHFLTLHSLHPIHLFLPPLHFLCFLTLLLITLSINFLIFFCLSNILGLSLSFPRSLHSLLFLYLIIFHSLSFFLSSLYPFFLFSSQSNSF